MYSGSVVADGCGMKRNMASPNVNTCTRDAILEYGKRRKVGKSFCGTFRRKFDDRMAAAAQTSAALGSQGLRVTRIGLGYASPACSLWAPLASESQWTFWLMLSHFPGPWA